jgi:hypothetical protein
MGRRSRTEASCIIHRNTRKPLRLNYLKSEFNVPMTCSKKRKLYHKHKTYFLEVVNIYNEFLSLCREDEPSLAIVHFDE